MDSFPRYLINLEKSTDRLQNMTESLGLLRLSFERVSAVNAQELSDEDWAMDLTPSIEYPYQLRSGELACFLSHRKCWKKLAESQQEWALIMEDHCVFSSRATKYLTNSDWIPAECEIVQFVFTKNPVYVDKTIELGDGNSLIRLKNSSPIGTSAYMISRKAAVLALETSQNIYGPVDNFLFGEQSCFTKKIKPWRLLGAVVKRYEQTVTTIYGRGRKSKAFNKERFLPKRLIKKLIIKIHRVFLSKRYQYWF